MSQDSRRAAPPDRADRPEFPVPRFLGQRGRRDHLDRRREGDGCGKAPLCPMSRVWRGRGFTGKRVTALTAGWAVGVLWEGRRLICQLVIDPSRTNSDRASRLSATTLENSSQNGGEWTLFARELVLATRLTEIRRQLPQESGRLHWQWQLRRCRDTPQTATMQPRPDLVTGVKHDPFRIPASRGSAAIGAVHRR
jgi:hypothetical protein